MSLTCAALLECGARACQSQVRSISIMRMVWRGIALLVALASLECKGSSEPSKNVPSIETIKKDARIIAEGARAAFEASPGDCRFPDSSEGGDPVLFLDENCAMHKTTSARDEFVVTTSHDLDRDGMVSEFTITVTAVAEHPCRAKVGPVEESSWQLSQPYFCPAPVGAEGATRRYYDYDLEKK